MVQQQKIVMKLTMGDAKKRAKALQAAVGLNGVESAALEDDKIVVVGTVDSVKLTLVLRKMMGRVDLLSVTEAKKEEKKGDDKGEPAWHPGYYMLPPHQLVMPEYYREPAGCTIL